MMQSRKTIRWGMIGCGAVAEVKSGPGFYKADHSALVAVTSNDAAQAQSFATRHGVAMAHTSNEALVADPAVDAVYIATPPSSHKPLSLLVARAGKHVYVEKPMAMRFEECREIVDACEQRGVRLFVAFYRRAMPRFLKIKEWIDSGAIGDVRTVRAVQYQPPAPEDRSRATLPWRLLPDVAGGGKFLDMGIHELDLFDFLFGAIEEVHGIASNQAGLYDVEDTVTATWRHASGVQGYGSWCYVSGQGEDAIQIVGSKGCISFEFFSDKPVRMVNTEGEHWVDIANPSHVQQPFIQSMVDDLNGGAPCPGSVESAVRSSWVADEVLKNYRKQKGY
jgi:predicted dehydrogenase